MVPSRRSGTETRDSSAAPTDVITAARSCCRAADTFASELKTQTRIAARRRPRSSRFSAAVRDAPAPAHRPVEPPRRRAREQTEPETDGDGERMEDQRSASARRPRRARGAIADEVPPPIAPADIIASASGTGNTCVNPASASVPSFADEYVSMSPTAAWTNITSTLGAASCSRVHDGPFEEQARPRTDRRIVGSGASTSLRASFSASRSASALSVRAPVPVERMHVDDARATRLSWSSVMSHSTKPMVFPRFTRRPMAGAWRSTRASGNLS